MISEAIKPILEHVLEQIRERFGSDLVALVLFGSFARGNADWHSDVDLLIVVRHLPSDWRQRGVLELAAHKWEVPEREPSTGA